MSETNAPENVDLDESFNGFDPDLMANAVLHNIIMAIEEGASEAAQISMPLALSKVFGQEPDMRDVMHVTTKLLHIVVIQADLARVIKELIPFDRESMPKEDSPQFEAFKAAIDSHPIIAMAHTRMKETGDEKLARRVAEVKANAGN